MIVSSPRKTAGSRYLNWYLHSKIDELNQSLGREVYKLEQVGGDKYRLISVKVISNGEPTVGVVLVPTTSATYLSGILDELWSMLNRTA